MRDSSWEMTAAAFKPRRLFSNRALNCLRVKVIPWNKAVPLGTTWSLVRRVHLAGRSSNCFLYICYWEQVHFLKELGEQYAAATNDVTFLWAKHYREGKRSSFMKQSSFIISSLLHNVAISHVLCCLFWLINSFSPVLFIKIQFIKNDDSYWLSWL